MAFWLMGDLTARLRPRMSSAGSVFSICIFLVAAGAMYTTSSDLNLILTGEQEAGHLGVNVTRVKLVVYVAASVLTGLAVSVSGAIGYVGLLVPHVMRMLFGTDYRLLIPTSAIGGAIVIVLADTLGADNRRANGIASGRHDRAGRRARIHLPDAQENSMSAGAGNGAAIGAPADRGRASGSRCA